MLFFDELVKGGFYTSNRILALSPAVPNIVYNLVFLFLTDFESEGRYFFLNHYAFVQNHSPISRLLFLIIFKNYLTQKLLLPKIATVIYYLDPIFEEGVIDRIWVALLQMALELLNPFFKKLRTR